MRRSVDHPVNIAVIAGSSLIGSLRLRHACAQKRQAASARSGLPEMGSERGKNVSFIMVLLL